MDFEIRRSVIEIQCCYAVARCVATTAWWTTCTDTTRRSFLQVNNPHCSRSQCKSIRRSGARAVRATIQIGLQRLRIFPRNSRKSFTSIKRSWFLSEEDLAKGAIGVELRPRAARSRLGEGPGISIERTESSWRPKQAEKMAAWQQSRADPGQRERGPRWALVSPPPWPPPASSGRTRASPAAASPSIKGNSPPPPIHPSARAFAIPCTATESHLTCSGRTLSATFGPSGVFALAFGLWSRVFSPRDFDLWAPWRKGLRRGFYHHVLFLDHFWLRYNTDNSFKHLFSLRFVSFVDL